MSFHDVLFPKNIAIFASGATVFSTSLASTRSGREVRICDWSEASQKFTIKNCKLSEMEFLEFNSFFRARMGRNFAFKFRDYADNKIIKQSIKPIDDARHKFQIYKVYEDKIASYKRIITKPAMNSVKAYIANDAAAIDNIDHDNGIITLREPLPFGQELTIDCVFDVAVRFNQDSYEYNIADNGSIILSDIELIEVIK